MHKHSSIRMAVSAAALAWTPVAATQAQTLAVGVPAPITSIDPHYHTLTPNIELDAHIFEPLIDMDSTSHIKPALAESWRLVDERTWEFKLRPAKFQDGSDFTAEDVVSTINRIPNVKNSPGSFLIYTRPITSMEIVDPHTVRMHTAGVYPLLPIDLSNVDIISHKLGTSPATEDFNSGKDAIGTGPFRFVSYRAGDRVELERNDGYWGEKPQWQHVDYRVISNDGARTAALLAGDVQLIAAVPTTDVARLRQDSRVRIAETVSLRIIYLGLDQSRDAAPAEVTGPNGEKLDHNPLKDQRVREALSIAINRPAIVERVMEGLAIPSRQFLPPGSFSYVPDLKLPAYDPTRAKALLAEAGFPNGFRITLHGPNDRYINDSRIIQAVGQMWTRVGVQTSVESLTFPSFIGHANKQDYAAFLLGWGSSTGEASDPLRSLVATFSTEKGWGAANRGRYSNAAVDALIDKALGTADDAAREKVLIEAERLVFSDVGIIPLHNQMNVWATRADLAYTPRTDEETRAQEVRAAK
ncbi:MAG TPA: ABC transporter substrate-binding protein [Acetobacteraceae bacterium]|jgi:peptide/nickel transport system substrate-binding protein|nr:ABC transporter substrate-binding protein [Acetobacteraceae bacterium]